MSRFTYFGPSSTALRAADPNVSAAGGEKTDVSNQSWPGPALPNTVGVPLTFGRCVLPGAWRLVPSAVKLIGRPDCAVKNPLTCQPPRMWLATPSCSHRLLGPAGS